MPYLLSMRNEQKRKHLRIKKTDLNSRQRMNMPAPVFPVLPTEKVRMSTITLTYEHHDGTTEVVKVAFPMSLYFKHLPAPVADIVKQRLETIAKSRGFTSGEAYRASCRSKREDYYLEAPRAYGVPIPI
jgi:hypothetical protein